MSEGTEVGRDLDLQAEESSAGIVVTDAQSGLKDPENHPRIAAFIWGGKVRPAPTLPYGRWRGAA